MTNKKSNKNKPHSKKKLTGEILNAFQSNPNQSYNYKQLSTMLGIKDKSKRKLVNKILHELAAKEQLYEQRPGKYRIKASRPYIEGKVDMTKNGAAYIISPDIDKDVFISPKNTRNAIHNDTVKVYLFARKRGKNPEGEIIEILHREKTQFTGIIEKSKKYAFLIPDDKNMHVDLYIAPDKLKGARDGEKVIGKITDWPKDATSPFGEVTEVLGMAGEHNVEMNSILADFSLSSDFPEPVKQATDKLNLKITEEEIKKRKDFRNTTTFTIDPEDAKDFDDALSIKELGKGMWEVGIHIADVTHYLQKGSVIDEEAVKRATSVYLVDRVVPMLPEILSNFACSLRPNEEKLAFSAVFHLDESGKIHKEWFGRTVIESDHRFSYSDAQEVIETGKGKLSDEILLLNKIAKNLREDRFKKGSIAFHSLEVKFNLDEKGKPTGVYFKEQKDANKLIEEFMLLTNKRVAEFVGNPKGDKKGKTFVYRVHDSPDPEKLRNFNLFVNKFGYSLNLKNDKDLARSMNTLLEQVEGKREENMIEKLAVRTMTKAYYTTNNIGHYGLSFSHYSHFTSPIRRYADVMVHRMLQHYLEGKSSLPSPAYEDICKHISEVEINAVEAERASVKYKQVEYLSDKIGEVFEGIISGVTDFGIFVELIDNKCEGMIRLREINDDYYELDEENYMVIGRKYGTKYQIGDQITVLVKKADLVNKQLEFKLA